MTTTNGQQGMQRNDGAQGRDLAELLKAKAPAMAKLAGEVLNVERLTMLALLATKKTPALAKCTADTILAAVMDAARLGLEPDGRQGAIIPFKGSAAFIPMVGGLIALAYRDPAIETIETVTVHEGDDFAYARGTSPFIRHVPNPERTGKERAIAWYCVTFIRGRAGFEIMFPADAEKARQSSPSVKGGHPSPWDTHFDEMVHKTVCKRRLKRCPSSPLLRAALDHDDEVEAVQVIDLGDTATNTRTAKVTKALADKKQEKQQPPPADDPPPDNGPEEPAGLMGDDEPSLAHVEAAAQPATTTKPKREPPADPLARVLVSLPTTGTQATLKEHLTKAWASTSFKQDQQKMMLLLGRKRLGLWATETAMTGEAEIIAAAEKIVADAGGFDA